jgi:diacylglycerol kinase (ATP)
MDTRPAFAMRQIFTGQPHLIDVGLLEDNLGRTEYWDNTVGIGFDATVTIRSRSFRYLRGFMIYLVAVLQTIILNHDAARLQVTSDQEKWEDDMLMLVLCNGGREGGGFNIAPEADNTDGIINYVGVRRVSRLMMLRLLPEFIKGTHQRFRQVRLGALQRLELQSDRPLLIHTDGEIFSGFGVDVRHLKAEVIPHAIQVMV